MEIVTSLCKCSPNEWFPGNTLFSESKTCVYLKFWLFWCCQAGVVLQSYRTTLPTPAWLELGQEREAVRWGLCGHISRNTRLGLPVCPHSPALPTLCLTPEPFRWALVTPELGGCLRSAAPPHQPLLLTMLPQWSKMTVVYQRVLWREKRRTEASLRIWNTILLNALL